MNKNNLKYLNNRVKQMLIFSQINNNLKYQSLYIMGMKIMIKISKQNQKTNPKV